AGGGCFGSLQICPQRRQASHSTGSDGLVNGRRSTNAALHFGHGGICIVLSQSKSQAMNPMRRLAPFLRGRSTHRGPMRACRGRPGAAMSFLFKMRSIADRASPFHVRLTNKLLQECVRFEDLVQIREEDKARLVEILKKDLARLHVAKDDLRQNASRV